MVGEIFAGIGALKTAFDMSKAIVDMSDAVKRDRLSIDLQKEILSALAAQSELTEEIGQLKEKLRSFEKWDAEKERYKLRQIATGAFAYALEKERAAGEPAHWLCTDCYENRKKSILKIAGAAEKSGADIHKALWKCHVCGCSIRVSFSVNPAYTGDQIDT